MNKNSLLAFVLIAFTVIFFNSSLWNNFWYGTILKKPVPTQQRQQQRTDNADSAARDTANVRVDDTVSVLTSAIETSVREPDGDGTRPALTDEEIAALARLRDSLARVNPELLETLDIAGIDSSLIMPQISEDTVIVETDRLVASISTKGARIISLKMKDYKYVGGPRKDLLIDLVPDGSAGGAQLTINAESFDDTFFNVIDTAGRVIILEAKSSDGRPVQKVFSFADGTYMIGYTVRGPGVSGRKVTLGWEGGIDDTEADAVAQSFGGGLDRRRAHYSDGRGVDHFEMKKRGVEEPAGRFRWVGMSSKYFFVAVVAEEAFDADLKIEGRDVTVRSADRKQSREVNIDYSVSYKFEAESSEINNQIYAGPNRIQELSSHELKFEKALFPVLSWARHIFWADFWFPPLAELILKLLQFFYGLVKDYGIAIFLLTLVSKIITYPMTQSSAKSMLRMKDLQPKLVALRSKYKNDPQKMNQEMMALYKAEGINPLNPGCLPMFLQMPIFIALFVVLRKAIELRGATTFVLPWVKDLSLPEAMFYLPGAGLPIYGNNVALMPILMAALTFFQQKQTITDPNQKMMIYMMPALMLVMFNGFPAGVVFYWTVSSALGLVQQMWLKPKMPAKPATATVTAGGVTQSVPVRKGSSGGGKKKRR